MRSNDCMQLLRSFGQCMEYPDWSYFVIGFVAAVTAARKQQ